MRRRAFLGALGAALPATAGCTGVLEDSTERTPYDVPPTTRRTDRSRRSRAAGNPYGAVRESVERTDRDPARLYETVGSRVIDLDTGPRTCALVGADGATEDSVAVGAGFTETATADGPARISVAVESRVDRPVELRTISVPVLADSRGELRRFGGEPRAERGRAPDPELLLVPTGENAPETSPAFGRSEGYWRVEEPISDVPSTRFDVGPEERVGIELAVVGSADTVGRPVGTYVYGLGGYGFRIAVWNTDRPGPRVDSRFPPDEPTPDREYRSWFHQANASTAAFLRPSTERIGLPGTVDFRFFNRSKVVLECGGWTLSKRRGDRWYRVATSGADCGPVSPGSHVERTVRADDESGADDGGVTPLGGGRYAMTVVAGSPFGSSGALFDVAGDPLELVPTGDATVTRDGATVRVDSPVVDHPGVTPVVVEAERVDGPNDRVRRHLPEQLYQSGNRGLRNALAPFDDGVDQVRLHTAREFVPAEERVLLGSDVFEISVRTPGEDDGKRAGRHKG